MSGCFENIALLALKIQLLLRVCTVCILVQYMLFVQKLGSLGYFSNSLCKHTKLVQFFVVTLKEAMSQEVRLAVYDLSRGLARSMSGAILGQQIDGIWHTGVVAFGYEYFFGGGIQKLPWGHFAQGNQMQPVNVLTIGTSTKTLHELEIYLRTISHQYTMQTYDLITNNCNNFANTVCLFLTGRGIPTHIVDLPRIVFSTPGGAMLRPMIENMQGNIRQQHGTGLDPFGGTPSSAIPAPAPAPAPAVGLEQQISESVTSLMLNTAEQAQTSPELAVLDDKPLLSMDSSTVNAMAKLLHNLSVPDGSQGSALSAAEHAALDSIAQKLVAESASAAARDRKGLASTYDFDVEEYLLLERLLATYPKSQTPVLFLLRLMFAHDRSSLFHDLSIVRELLRRLLAHQRDQQDPTSPDTQSGFASVPAHVLALCAISNLLAHEHGVNTLVRPVPDNAISAAATASASDADAQVAESDTASADDTVLNDVLDVILSGINAENGNRAEVRQMSATLAYNLTLACTKDFNASGPWRDEESGDDSSLELNGHALQLLCACVEGLAQERDAAVRKRRLMIVGRLARTFPQAVGALCTDLGFVDTLQQVQVQAIPAEEKTIVGEVLHYCALYEQQ